MKISPEQKTFNDMLQVVIDYAQKHSGLQVLLLAAVTDDKGQVAVKSSINCPVGFGHILGEGVIEMRRASKPMQKVVESMICGMACSLQLDAIAAHAHKHETSH